MIHVFTEVREPYTGKLLFRFDPERDLIEIQDRGQKTIIDLSQFRRAVDEAVDKPCESDMISIY